MTAALHRAKSTAAGSAKAARARLTVELDAALAIALDRDLHKAGGYTSVETYAEAEVDLNRQYVYELIADSKRIRAVMAAGLSDTSGGKRAAPTPGSYGRRSRNRATRTATATFAPMSAGTYAANPSESVPARHPPEPSPAGSLPVPKH
ncbi:hypothetical protein [Streptomyces sp. NPDC056399]|uniref:hypothetical protein n=1 Tax=Streptomyces sp. NPDC056399 TaxID=3345807 RepID=UPI0035D67DE3